MEKSKVQLSLILLITKMAKVIIQKKIINVEKQKVPCEVGTHHRILPKGSKVKTNFS